MVKTVVLGAMMLFASILAKIKSSNMVNITYKPQFIYKLHPVLTPYTCSVYTDVRKSLHTENMNDDKNLPFTHG